RVVLQGIYLLRKDRLARPAEDQRERSAPRTVPLGFAGEVGGFRQHQLDRIVRFDAELLPQPFPEISDPQLVEHLSHGRTTTGRPSMKLTRKQFLGTIATGLVGTALPGVLKGASAKKSPSSADFQGLVGNSFQFRSAKGNSSQLVLHQFENK